MKITRLLTPEEFIQIGDDAVANGLYRDDRTVFLPGMAWTMPWVYDPTGERERRGEHVIFKEARKGTIGFLSKYYWDDWSHIRPPMSVVCPNGEVWEIDRRSKNGDGWSVTGEFPLITCMPSIVVYGYHGWLKDGEFSEDLEGRGPNGLVLKETR